MKKILLFFTLSLLFCGYSINAFGYDKSIDLDKLRDGKTHRISFTNIGAPPQGPGPEYFVNIEYKKSGADWWIWAYSAKAIREANALFNDLGAFTGDIKTGPFVDSFFAKDDHLEQHLYEYPQFLGVMDEN